MRWIKRKYHDLDKRVIRKFALLPIVIENVHGTEYRWLETCYVRQIYRGIRGFWENKAFADKCEYEKFILDQKMKEDSV